MACDSRRILMGDIVDPSVGFAAADSGAVDAAGDAERGLVSYCPTNKCPPGWTTCPSSRFPCDVNLLVDVNNCGACGAACPADGPGAAFTCVDGACKLECKGSGLDCDGLLDNGCEASNASNINCGACGVKCTDPAKPCMYQGAWGNSPVACGCLDGRTPCGTDCADLGSDDAHCGDCGTACDPGGDGAPPIDNGYYGCSGGACGAMKCNAGFGDCDGSPANGCETSLLANDDCGACGKACPAGQACRLDPDGRPTCMCPPGLTFCETACSGETCRGECVDLTKDSDHCGACGAYCPRTFSLFGFLSEIPYARSTCDYGTCVMRCIEGRADCNDSEVDGCEVDIASDPRNCGGCGQACDLAAGQACVAGRCTVEPCPLEDAGGGTAR